MSGYQLRVNDDGTVTAYTPNPDDPGITVVPSPSKLPLDHPWEHDETAPEDARRFAAGWNACIRKCQEINGYRMQRADESGRNGWGRPVPAPDTQETR